MSEPSGMFDALQAERRAWVRANEGDLDGATPALVAAERWRDFERVGAETTERAKACDRLAAEHAALEERAHLYLADIESLKHQVAELNNLMRVTIERKDAEYAALVAAMNDVRSVAMSQHPGGFAGTVARIQGIVYEYPSLGYPGTCPGTPPTGDCSPSDDESLAGAPTVSEPSELRNAFQEYVVARDIDLNRPRAASEDGGYQPTERHRVARDRLDRAFADADRLAAEHAALVRSVAGVRKYWAPDYPYASRALRDALRRLVERYDALPKDG